MPPLHRGAGSCGVQDRGNRGCRAGRTTHDVDFHLAIRPTPAPPKQERGDAGCVCAIRPEFSPQALDALRGPLETGEVIVARANAHIRYPARVQLVAAMNPCRCGLGGPGRGACGRAPRCQSDYQGRISGPLMDRIDLQVEVPPVTAADLALPAPTEGATEAAARVMAARAVQAERAVRGGDGAVALNARADG